MNKCNDARRQELLKIQENDARRKKLVNNIKNQLIYYIPHVINFSLLIYIIVNLPSK